MFLIFSFYLYFAFIIDMASAAFIEPLPVIEFVAQLLGKDVLSRPLSDSDRVKVSFSFYCCCSLVSFLAFDLIIINFVITGRLKRHSEE